MAKYSYEQKLEAVLNVVEKHMSCKASANKLGTAEVQVRRWVRRYDKFGTEGLTLKNGTYDGNFKVQVIEYMHENHLSQFETAVKFGIPTDVSVGKWERIYYEKGPQALLEENRGRKNLMSSNNQKKINLEKQLEEDLIKEVQRLRMENAYLKKLNALVQERIQRENMKK